MVRSWQEGLEERQPERIVIVVEDVKPRYGSGTDRLQPEEEKYHFLLENSQDILWTVDLTGTWQFVTSNVERIVHLKVGDLIGKKAWDFVTPETRATLMEMLQRRLRGEDIPPYEVVVIDGYGRQVPFEVNTSPIYDKGGKIIGIQGISRDVTERKRAENAVRKSEEKFRDLVENLSDWVWEIDANGVFTYSSPRVIALLAYAPEEIVGRSLYDLVRPEDSELVRRILDRLVTQQKPFAAIEFRLISRGGEPVAVETSGTPIFGDDGLLRGFRGICRDVSDRKRAEQALHRAYGELERRVEERTEELRYAKAQAELYLDLMSHDINNMNTVAIGNAEMAGQLVSGNKEAVSLLNRTVEMLQSSSQLIANVRKLQQAETGALQAETVDLCNILEDVRKKYASREGRIVEIDIAYLEKGQCMVTANRLLWDVFANLVGNSIKHSPPDRPVAINIELSKVSEEGQACYRVAIEDDGPGITDELKNRLFSRLQPGDAKAAGKGLGLYLVKTLVEDFGGWIRVEDRVRGQPARGARFVVLLPAA